MQAKLKELQTVKPFMFPCKKCEAYQMHKIYQQPYGLAITIPLFNTPLASTHKAFHIVCMTCTTVSSQIKKENIHVFEAGYIPKSIYDAYPVVKEFYSPGYFDINKVELINGLDEEDAIYLENTIKYYNLEI